MFSGSTKEVCCGITRSRMFDRPSDSYPLSNRTPAEWKVDSDIQYSQASSQCPRIRKTRSSNSPMCQLEQSRTQYESNRFWALWIKSAQDTITADSRVRSS